MSNYILTLQDEDAEDIFEVEMDITGLTVKQLLDRVIDEYHQEQKATNCYSLKFKPCVEK